MSHAGCVNTLAISPYSLPLPNSSSLPKSNSLNSKYSSYLISGSDDLFLNLYKIPEYEILSKVKTAHDGNIFKVRFSQSGKRVVSCSVSGSVQWHDLNSILSANTTTDTRNTRNTTNSSRGGSSYSSASYRGSTSSGSISGLFKCHQEMCLSVQFDLHSEHVILSCSDDGCVNLYDLRQRDQCLCDGCLRHIYIDINCISEGWSKSTSQSHSGSRERAGSRYDIRNKKGIHSMTLTERYPYRLALGCTDGYLRFYDRRLLKYPYEVEGVGVGRESSGGLTWSYMPSVILSGVTTGASGGMTGEVGDEVTASTEGEGEKYYESLFEYRQEHSRIPITSTPPETTTTSTTNTTNQTNTSSSSTNSRKHPVSAIQFSQSGNQLLASYIDSYIYLINLEHLFHLENSSGTTSNIGTSNITFSGSSIGGSIGNTGGNTGISSNDDKYILEIYGGHLNRHTMIKDILLYEGTQLSGTISSSSSSVTGGSSTVTRGSSSTVTSSGSSNLTGSTVPDWYSSDCSSWIMSGCDSGNLFIWPKHCRTKDTTTTNATTPYSRGSPTSRSIMKPYRIIKGDGQVVNSIVIHPQLECLCVSGIDCDIKVFEAIGGISPEHSSTTGTSSTTTTNNTTTTASNTTGEEYIKLQNGYIKSSPTSRNAILEMKYLEEVVQSNMNALVTEGDDVYDGDFLEAFLFRHFLQREFEIDLDEEEGEEGDRDDQEGSEDEEGTGGEEEGSGSSNEGSSGSDEHTYESTLDVPNTIDTTTTTDTTTNTQGLLSRDFQMGFRNIFTGRTFSSPPQQQPQSYSSQQQASSSSGQQTSSDSGQQEGSSGVNRSSSVSSKRKNEEL